MTRTNIWNQTKKIFAAPGKKRAFLHSLIVGVMVLASASAPFSLTYAKTIAGSLAHTDASLAEVPAPEENTLRTNQAVPEGAVGVWITLIGAGGSGGAGGDGTGGTRSGGGGGGGAATVQRSFIPATALGSTYSVTVGTGNAGGAPVDNADGLAGNSGGASVFSSGSLSISAGGGQAGGAGTRSSTSGAGGTGGIVTIAGIDRSIIKTVGGTAGGSGSQTTGTAQNGTNNANGGAAGGGGGGGTGWLGGLYAGGTGGNSTTVNGGAAGANSTQNPGVTPTNATAGNAGAGAGGGGSSRDRGGNGGAGGQYGGGGGGGSGGVQASAGGAGGNGYTLLEWTSTVPSNPTPPVTPTPTTETVFMLAGTMGDPNAVKQFLQGQVTKGRTLVPVSYPNLKKDINNDMLEGARILNEKLLATPGKKIVFAHSLGAVVSSCWLKQYGPTSGINPADLEFILMGNSVRPYNGYYPLNNWTQTNGKPFVSKELVSPITDTRYKVTDMAIQYDGWADWPNLTTTGIPVSNADWGKLIYHLMYTNFPLDRPDYRKHTEDNITYVLIPVNQWWSSASTLTKVEAGYSRPE